MHLRLPFGWSCEAASLRLWLVSWLRFLVGVSMLVGCTSQGVIGEGGNPFAGSQTGDEGSYAGCASIRTTEIDADTARDLGFPVDDHLPLFEQEFEMPFHHGNLDCTSLPPRVDGNIRFRASLQRIEHEELEPTWAYACPEWKYDRLIYHAAIQLETDEGTLSGTVEGPAYAEHPEPGTEGYPGLVFFGESPISDFAGSFGIRVNPQRPHQAGLGWQVAIGAPDFGSRANTSVDYTDGREPMQDQGDGMFWPADFIEGQVLCGWLNLEGPQRDLISLDRYNDL